MAATEWRQGPPRCLAQQQKSSWVNGGSMIFLQRPVNVLHFEIIPQADAIRLQPGRMFSGLCVKLFLPSAQQQLTNHLGTPFLCLVVRTLFKDSGSFNGFVKTTQMPSDCNVTHVTNLKKTLYSRTSKVKKAIFIYNIECCFYKVYLSVRKKETLPLHLILLILFGICSLIVTIDQTK